MLGLIVVSCITDNQMARQYGGTEEISLLPGQRLVNATWKEANLWYLTEDMPIDYVPKKNVYFKEKSNYGLAEGTIVFHESR